MTVGDPMLKAMRPFLRRLPRGDRCRFCCSPFEGPFAPILARVGKGRYARNPHYCAQCIGHLERMPIGGTEIEFSMLFADVRGSTKLAQRLGPTELHALIARFYAIGGEVLTRCDALIDRLMGDQVVGYFLPVFAGRAHADRAVEAAVDLLRSTGHADAGGPWIPIGVGVNTGLAFIGTVGQPGGMIELTALGDPVNTAARLASSAGAGEVLVSDATARAAALDTHEREKRRLTLKGITAPVDVHVMTVVAGP